jgi:hypothetical protein
MTTPPPLPPRQPPPLPPPLPSQRRKIPTAVYFALFILLLAVNVVWVYQRAATRVPGNSAYVIGVVEGGVLLPLGAAAGIACIWRPNRGFRGVVRVLFWASLFLLFTKLNQLVNDMHQRPRHVLLGTAQFRHSWQSNTLGLAVAEPGLRR